MVEVYAFVMDMVLQCEAQANAFELIHSPACAALGCLKVSLALVMVNAWAVPFHFAPTSFWYCPQE